MGTTTIAAGGSAMILSLLVSLYTAYASFTCKTTSKSILSVFALGIIALFICTIVMFIRQKSNDDDDSVKKIPLWKSIMLWIAFAIYAVTGFIVVFLSRKCFDNKWKSGLLASWIIIPIFVIPSLSTN